MSVGKNNKCVIWYRAPLCCTSCTCSWRVLTKHAARGKMILLVRENLYLWMLLGEQKTKTSIATWQGGHAMQRRTSDTNTYWHQRQLSELGCRLPPQRHGRCPPPPSHAALSPPHTGELCKAPSISLSLRKPKRRVQCSPCPPLPVTPARPANITPPDFVWKRGWEKGWEAMQTELKHSF